MNQILDITRVAMSLIFLLYSSWSDYKRREVSNIVWLVYAPSAIAITITQTLFFSSEAWINISLSFLITTALSLTLFYAGAFGGADAKALICISLALPTFPEAFPQSSTNVFSPFLPLTVFFNAVLFAASSVFYILIRNIVWMRKSGKKLFESFDDVSLGRKIITVLCAHKISIYELKNKQFSYPLEEIYPDELGNIKKRLLLVPADENREEALQRIEGAVKEGKTSKDVWATPGLPMLIFITVGFIFAILIGDAVWITVRALLRGLG